MINPILGNKKYLIIYLLLWAVIISAHSFSLYYFYNLPGLIAVLDGIIYNFIFLLLGFGIWYIVKYNNFELINLINLIVSHVLAALLIISLWLSVAGLATDLLFGDLKQQVQFSELLPVRVIVGAMYYLIISLIYYLMIYYQNFKEKVEYEAKMESKFREAELNTLKAQINPHFIFNSLNSISSLTMSDPVIAQEMIVKLSDFFRMTLKKNDSQFALLSEEIAFSRLYFEIEKIRFKEKLDFIIDCTAENDTIMVPHLILQPLLENAIKHGVQESIEKVEVRLNCHVENQLLNLSLSNHFDSDSSITGQGIGQKNIKERLKLIYNRTDLFETKIMDSQYIAIIKIPVNYAL
jgi:sensor histidine kinase YesM